MKEMPALLCAILAARNPTLLACIFGRVIDDGKMLRNFVQIIRSGVTGRKSLGSAPKRLVRSWFEQQPYCEKTRMPKCSLSAMTWCRAGLTLVTA
jgi:60 kDa SS-A/Ro ribonucleoprotein